MKCQTILGLGLAFGMTYTPTLLAQSFPSSLDAAPSPFAPSSPPPLTPLPQVDGAAVSFRPTGGSWNSSDSPAAYYAMRSSAASLVTSDDPPALDPSPLAPSPSSELLDSSATSAASSGIWGSECGTACGDCEGVVLKSWFAGGGALFFNREAESDLPFVVLDGNAGQVALGSSDVDQEWTPGFEFYLGRYFNEGRNAVVLNYWGLFPSEAQSSVFDPGLGLQAIDPAWANAFVDDRDPLTTDLSAFDLFDSAQAFRLAHGAEYQSVEANLIGFGIGGVARAPFGASSSHCASDGCGPVHGYAGPGSPAILPESSRLRTQWLAGVRWFRFRDWLEFGASQTDTFFGTGSDDLYFNSNVTNDLVGFQLGGRLDYCLSPRWSIYAGGKAGVYNNHARVDNSLGNGDGPAYIDNSPNPSLDGRLLRSGTTTDNLAFMGELDTGLSYHFTDCWSIYGGWRLVGISGVATSLGEIPNDIANLNEWRQNRTSESLLLHGGYAGVAFNW